MATAAIAAIVAVHSKLPMGLAVVAVATTEAVVMAAVIATVVVAVAAITISAMRNMQPMDLAGSVKAIATVAAIVVAITEAAAAVAVAIAIAISAMRNMQPMDLAGSVEAIAVVATEATAIIAVATAATVADSTRRSSIVDWWEFHWSGDPSGEPLRDPHHGDQQPDAHCGDPSDVHGPNPATKAQQLPHGAHMTRRGLQLQDRHK